MHLQERTTDPQVSGELADVGATAYQCRDRCGGLMATKPYASGGAYTNRMSDYCGGRAFDPKQRLGDKACPYTAGYWAFLDRQADRLGANPRMRRPLAGLRRLADREAVVAREEARGTDPP